MSTLEQRVRELTSHSREVARKNPYWDRENNSLYMSFVRTAYGSYFREHYEPIGDEL